MQVWLETPTQVDSVLNAGSQRQCWSPKENDRLRKFLDVRLTFPKRGEAVVHPHQFSIPPFCDLRFVSAGAKGCDWLHASAGRDTMMCRSSIAYSCIDLLSTYCFDPRPPAGSSIFGPWIDRWESLLTWFHRALTRLILVSPPSRLRNTGSIC